MRAFAAASLTERSSGSRDLGARTIGRIPVRNLWLLMLYASELVRIDRTAAVRLDEDPEDLPDLVAELLVRTVERRLRRNLSMGYRRDFEILTRVRGRIDVLTTERRRLLERGRVACRFDRLTIDTPRNRFVRFALETLARIVRRPELAHTCRRQATDFALLGVSAGRPSRVELAADRLGRHDVADGTMLALARLACDLALPTEEAGTTPMFAPAREEHWVRRLYEKAVAGFYNVALGGQGWTVRPGQELRWPVTASTAGALRILPNMRTDIVLTRSIDARQVVVDTKFTAIVTAGWYREESVRSGYLYQIYAYLRSQEGTALTDRAEGVLLHPAVGGAVVDEAIYLQQHLLRFSTVDLTAAPVEIRARLLAVIEAPLALVDCAVV